jgi:hypothetical protein
MRIKDLEIGKRYQIIWRGSRGVALFIRPCKKFFFFDAGLFEIKIHITDMDYGHDYDEWKLKKATEKNIICLQPDK